MKVISTDAGASLPAKDGQAEILNSSLMNYSSVTLCARFLTHQFSTQPDGYPFQTLITSGRNSLLSSYVSKPCDRLYRGCTDNYKDQVERQEHQWSQGKVFGDLYLSGKNYFYPVWLPGVWNTACITVRATQQYYRVNLNLNGQNVFQSKEIAEDFFKSSKARI